MGDLISRKALMERVLQEEYDNDIHTDGRAKTIHHGEYRHFYKVISEQPTALDLENIIRKLREIMIESSSSEFDYGIDTAIEILKSAANATNGKIGG